MSKNVRRYAVLDASGKKLNSIYVNDPYPQDYWPGYGRFITCEYGEDAPAAPANLNIRKGDRPFTYLMLRPLAQFSMGDSMSLVSGEITYAPRPDPEPEVLVEEEEVIEQ